MGVADSRVQCDRRHDATIEVRLCARRVRSGGVEEGRRNQAKVKSTHAGSVAATHCRLCPMFPTLRTRRTVVVGRGESVGHESVALVSGAATPLTGSLDSAGSARRLRSRWPRHLCRFEAR